MVGGSELLTLDLCSPLVGTSQQGISVMMTELMLPCELKHSYTSCDFPNQLFEMLLTDVL